MQADLLVKVAPYDRNLRQRAGERVRILLVTKPGDDESLRWAQQMRAALAEKSRVADLPHTESVVAYPGADELAKRSRAEQISIVVLTSALASEAAALRRAFEGANVLTVAPESELVRGGVVLGFELVSGKPRMFFNLEQARRQGVAMSSDLLKLMTVVP